ncbi:MAG: polysaccharide deacetylase family protein [Verrucomicrobiales bacterium]|nr:polysaccharide deacetylase family protein [Verrucomicrobiales bacterium]
MKTSLITRLAPVCCLAAFCCLAACDKVTPYLDTVKKALDRETEEEAATRKPIAEADIPPPPAPVKMEPTINKEARVSVLGYHDFTAGSSTNDMILNIENFRKQMQAIKDAKLPVISMRQFLDWKAAKADIPAECVMITIDDGWKATHTLAMGVLKEFGYPFTIFLYKNYIGVGGRSLTHDEVRELAANGATISSHSVSHQNMSKRGGRSDEAYDAWLKEELGGSLRFLEENFGDTGAVVKTFAFPYGIYNDRVLELAREFGYEACFTVNGKKTPWDAESLELGRYVVHGTTLANFDPALDFGGGTVTSTGRKLLAESTNETGQEQAPLVTVKPPANSVVGNRLPLIEIDLSKLSGVVADSLILRVSGFGQVPQVYNPATGLVTYQIPQRLRLDSCAVQLTFRHAASKDNEVIGWTFQVDQMADYLSSDITVPGKNDSRAATPADEKAVKEKPAPPTATPSI